MQRIILVEDNVKEYCNRCMKDQAIYQCYNFTELQKKCGTCDKVLDWKPNCSWREEFGGKELSPKEQREWEIHRREELRKESVRRAA